MGAMPVSTFALDGSNNATEASNSSNDLVIYLNDTGATILTDVSNDTRETVSALSCNVYVKIDDDTCAGYDVYVDGVYELTEGKGGTPDGYCAFYVTAGTHTIEIRKNGCSASITKNFECGVTYRWVSMPDYWCECGDQEGSREVKFRGTAQGDPFGCYSGGTCQDVSVTELISGGEIPDYVVVVLLNRAPKGYFDSSIQHGDKVEVYGKYSGSSCDISINGENYYIKKVEPSGTLSINVWTDKSEYKIGETVTIYYQTNKKCTAKLTLTKPDGGDVVYGPNEIPASTRSKSATAGYPTGKRTVVFEAWAGAEYKKATCYFEVVEEAKKVKIRGEILVDFPIISFYSFDVKLDEILDDPTGNLRKGEIVNVYGHRSGPAQVDDVTVGDEVEVFGEYLGYVEGATFERILLSDWDESSSDHYVKKIEEKKPDLIIQSIDWSPSSPNEGDTVAFTVKIKNQGSGSAGSSTVKYYIDGSYVDSDTVPSLSVGSTATQNFTWTANKCGNVQVKAVADATNAVDESNEGNNEKTKTVSVACPNHPPTAYIDSITPNPANQGETVSFSGHGTDPDGDSIIAYNWRSSIDGQLSTHLSFKTSKLSVGTHTIYFKVKDVHDVWSDEATMTLVVNEEFNWDEIIETTEAQQKIYEVYKNYIFNGHWWSRLVGKSAEEVQKDTQNIFNPLDEAVGAILAVLLPGGDLYSLTKMSFTVTKTVIGCIKVHYYSVISSTLERRESYCPNLDGLIGTCDEVINDAKSHKAGALHSSLLKEKELTEIAYKQAQSYDSLINGSIRIFSLWREPYTAIKNQIACFRHYLEARYSYITLLLDGKSKKLNEEMGPEWALRDVALPPPPFEFFIKTKLDLLGSLSDPEDSDVRRIYLTKGSKIAVNLQEGYYPNTDGPYTFKFYVKYGSVPTEKSYGWKGEKYGVINIDKTGTYYFMVRSNGYGEYRLKITEYPDWYPVGKPLDLELLIFSCPVHVTITDKSGRVITDTGINEIPNANIIVKGEEKIFYLPLDCTYSTEINAYDTGTFNFTRVSPIGNDISITKFENIPVTSSTKASVEIEPGVTEYTMSLDYNGDGTTDEVRSPDVNETIEVEQNSYTIQLHSGWNLISLPILPDDSDVLDVMSSVDGNWNSVWSFENGEWKR
jgi:hypothetical protein